MEKELNSLLERALREVDSAGDQDSLEELRVRYLGRKGELTARMRRIGALPPEERPALGKLGNRVKSALEGRLAGKREELLRGDYETRIREEGLDVSLPGRRTPQGGKPTQTATLEEIVAIFRAMGFQLESGPEAESEHYNFDSLNMPADHPARDMQDTLYLGPGILLRTHTSPVQIRTMEKQPPPVRMICAGKTFRADTADASHSPMFHQLEGLMVDRGVSFADLKGVLAEFVRLFFGPDTALRFRPSFFPFTEPSAEVDISCIVCGGEGCPVCSRKGWLEILGAGMVDPLVFQAVGYDPEEFTGFAFGLGIDRIAMLKYGIDDIRLFYENDLRFLNQF